MVIVIEGQVETKVLEVLQSLLDKADKPLVYWNEIEDYEDALDNLLYNKYLVIPIGSKVVDTRFPIDIEKRVLANLLASCRPRGITILVPYVYKYKPIDLPYYLDKRISRSARFLFKVRNDGVIFKDYQNGRWRIYQLPLAEPTGY